MFIFLMCHDTYQRDKVRSEDDVMSIRDMKVCHSFLSFALPLKAYGACLRANVGCCDRIVKLTDFGVSETSEPQTVLKLHLCPFEMLLKGVLV